MKPAQPTADTLFAEAHRAVTLRALDRAGILENLRWSHPGTGRPAAMTPAQLAALRRELAATDPGVP